MKSKTQPPKKAVVLLSGGLDSATTLFCAIAQGYAPECLVFDYGQRHRKEIEAARKISRIAGCKIHLIKIGLPWKGSALLEKDKKIRLVAGRMSQAAKEIPATYVPARNIIFLSFALSCAEAIGAEAIYIGAHAQDYSGYPDCRPEFYQAFKGVIAKGTKAGVEGKSITIKAPLLHKTKAQIIRLGHALGVPFEMTWSCYKGGRTPCGKCDSCYYRSKGFKEAGLLEKDK